MYFCSTVHQGRIGISDLRLGKASLSAQGDADLPALLPERELEARIRGKLSRPQVEASPHHQSREGREGKSRRTHSSTRRREALPR